MVLQALWGFASALLLTVAVEAPVSWLLGLRTWREQAVLALVNAVTNPALNLVLTMLAYFGAYTVKSPFDPLLAALEAAVIAVEAGIIRAALGRSLARSAAISAAANAASWLAGALILWHRPF